MNDKFPPLTTASLVAYNHLGPFSEVVPAEKMAELEAKLSKVQGRLLDVDVDFDSKEKLRDAIEDMLNILAA